MMKTEAKEQLRKIKVSPNEEALLLKNLKEEKRKVRLLQVRQQEKLIAKDILKAVKAKKDKEWKLLEEVAKENILEKQKAEIEEIQKVIDRQLNEMGAGHRSASQIPVTKAEIPAAIITRAKQRQTEALNKLRQEKKREASQAQEKVRIRRKALEKEQERSAKVVSQPPPPADALRVLDGLDVTAASRTKTLDSFASTRYHLQPFVEKADYLEQIDAKQWARVEETRRKDFAEHKEGEEQERAEKADLRHKQARREVLLQQEQYHLDHDLEQLEYKDRMRRQKCLNQIPANIFQPPHYRTEALQERQAEMETKFHKIFQKRADKETMYLDLDKDQASFTSEEDSNIALDHELYKEDRPKSLHFKSADAAVQALATGDVDVDPGLVGGSHVRSAAESVEEQTGNRVIALLSKKKKDPLSQAGKLIDSIRRQQKKWAENLMAQEAKQKKEKGIADAPREEERSDSLVSMDIESGQFTDESEGGLQEQKLAANGIGKDQVLPAASAGLEKPQTTLLHPLEQAKLIRQTGKEREKSGTLGKVTAEASAEGIQTVDLEGQKRKLDFHRHKLDLQRKQLENRQLKQKLRETQYQIDKMTLQDPAVVVPETKSQSFLGPIGGAEDNHFRQITSAIAPDQLKKETLKDTRTPDAPPSENEPRHKDEGREGLLASKHLSKDVSDLHKNLLTRKVELARKYPQLLKTWHRKHCSETTDDVSLTSSLFGDTNSDTIASHDIERIQTFQKKLLEQQKRLQERQQKILKQQDEQFHEKKETKSLEASTIKQPPQPGREKHKYASLDSLGLGMSFLSVDGRERNSEAWEQSLPSLSELELSSESAGVDADVESEAESQRVPKMLTADKFFEPLEGDFSVPPPSLSALPFGVSAMWDPVHKARKISEKPDVSPIKEADEEGIHYEGLPSLEEQRLSEETQSSNSPKHLAAADMRYQLSDSEPETRRAALLRNYIHRTMGRDALPSLSPSDLPIYDETSKHPWPSLSFWDHGREFHLVEPIKASDLDISDEITTQPMTDDRRFEYGLTGVSQENDILAADESIFRGLTAQLAPAPSRWEHELLGSPRLDAPAKDFPSAVSAEPPILKEMAPATGRDIPASVFPRLVDLDHRYGYQGASPKVPNHQEQDRGFEEIPILDDLHATRTPKLHGAGIYLSGPVVDSHKMTQSQKSSSSGGSSILGYRQIALVDSKDLGDRARFQASPPDTEATHIGYSARLQACSLTSKNSNDQFGDPESSRMDSDLKNPIGSFNSSSGSFVNLSRYENLLKKLRELPYKHMEEQKRFIDSLQKEDSDAVGIESNNGGSLDPLFHAKEEDKPLNEVKLESDQRRLTEEFMQRLERRKDSVHIPWPDSESTIDQQHASILQKIFSGKKAFDDTSAAAKSSIFLIHEPREVSRTGDTKVTKSPFIGTDDRENVISRYVSSSLDLRNREELHNGLISNRARGTDNNDSVGSHSAAAQKAIDNVDERSVLALQERMHSRVEGAPLFLTSDQNLKPEDEGNEITVAPSPDVVDLGVPSDGMKRSFPLHLKVDPSSSVSSISDSKSLQTSSDCNDRSNDRKSHEADFVAGYFSGSLEYRTDIESSLHPIFQSTQVPFEITHSAQQTSHLGVDERLKIDTASDFQDDMPSRCSTAFALKEYLQSPVFEEKPSAQEGFSKAYQFSSSNVSPTHMEVTQGYHRSRSEDGISDSVDVQFESPIPGSQIEPAIPDPHFDAAIPAPRFEPAIPPFDTSPRILVDSSRISDKWVKKSPNNSQNSSVLSDVAGSLVAPLEQSENSRPGERKEEAVWSPALSSMDGPTRSPSPEWEVEERCYRKPPKPGEGSTLNLHSSVDSWTFPILEVRYDHPPSVRFSALRPHWHGNNSKPSLEPTSNTLNLLL